MQPPISLRDAIVATIVLSPAFIAGLSLPWTFHNALAERSSVLSGGIVDAFAHEVRASTGADEKSQRDIESRDEDDSDDDDSDSDEHAGGHGGSGDGATGAGPTATGGGGGFGASGVPQPTGM